MWDRGWEYYNANMDIFSTQYDLPDLHCLLYISTQYIYPIKLSRGKWYKDEICDMTGHHVIRMGTSLSAEICGWIGDTVLQSQHVS